MTQLSWHHMSPEDVACALGIECTRGLTMQEAAARLTQYGRNDLPRRRAFSASRILLSHARSPLSVLLVGAAFAAFLLGEYIDAGVIACAWAIMVGLGFFQEGKATRVFDALSQALPQETVVRRDGAPLVVPVADVVPGDVVLLASGKTIPADMRLIRAAHLAVNESAFTGEWVPVQKNIETALPDVPAARTANMAWGGTIVSEGTGEGVVVSTGARTVFGTLAQHTVSVDASTTPLMHELEGIARVIVWLVLAVIGGMVVLGIARGHELAETVLTGIAVAVAAMPEGLPAAVTVSLAVAMEAIMRRGGLVKSLVAAETLGSTTLIFTDKTGTLTEGAMRVSRVWSARGISLENSSAVYEDNRRVVEGAVLASDAFTESKPEGLIIRGRPVERAIIEAGLAVNLVQSELFAGQHARLSFLQFESKRRYAASLNRTPSGHPRMYFSGAPETLLQLSVKVAVADGARSCTREDVETFTAKSAAESVDGRRLIGVAYSDAHTEQLPQEVHDGVPRELVFLGLLVLEDTIRPDVPEAITHAQQMGVRVAMLTGDFPETARAIAHETGITKTADAHVLTGEEISQLSDADLAQAITSTAVFARVSPDEKLRLVRVARARGEVVAMTGDGVNDAPALIAADVGVAVGSGTDVAKAAADVVLLENSFSTITAAIREGRRAVHNLRTSVAYLLSTSIGEVGVIGGAVAFGFPVPLIPTQLLWTNIVTEGFMSVLFAFEPEHAARTHTERRHALVDASLVRFLILSGVGMAVVLFLFYALLLAWPVPLADARTLMFAAFSLASLSFVFPLRLWHHSVFNYSLRGNAPLLLGYAVSMSILAAALFVPPVRDLLELTPLSPAGGMALVTFFLAGTVLVEAAKYATMRGHTA